MENAKQFLLQDLNLLKIQFSNIQIELNRKEEEIQEKS